MTFSLMHLIVTLSKKDTWISIKCHFAECCVLFIVILNVIMLSVVILSVVMLSVMAPISYLPYY